MVDAKGRKVRSSTLESYKGHIEIHLKPYYGQTAITNINLDAVEKFIADCDERKVSVATTKKILRTFGAIMDYACKRKYIDHNPVKYAEKPSQEIDMEEEEAIEIYTPEQIRLLINGIGWIKKEGYRARWDKANSMGTNGAPGKIEIQIPCYDGSGYGNESGRAFG